MSDNHDDNGFDEEIDFEDDINFGEDAGFDDYSSSNSLGDLWNNNPMVKVGVVLAGIAIIAFGVFLFGGGEEQVQQAELRTTPETTTPTSTTEPYSEEYVNAREARNQGEYEEAVRQQGTDLPSSLEREQRPIFAEQETEPEEDPLERWRKLQEQRARQQPQRPQPQVTTAPQPQVDTRAQAVTALSTAMSTQMEGILGNRAIPPLQIEQITAVSYLESLQAEEEERVRQEQEERDAQNNEQPPAIILLPAGEIEYAQLITEANSDVPGPILAQIASGPLRGSRVLGSFEVQNDFLILSFNQIVIDGESFPANAVALDPATTNVGVATEVDHRYFTRIVLPAAASFVEGLGRAIAQSESTSVTVNDSSTTSTEEDLDLRQEVFSGVEELSGEVGDTLDEIASETRPLVRVASGTPIGIMFVDPIIQE